MTATITKLTPKPIQVSLSVEDFDRLLDAAGFGVRKAEGFQSDYVVRAWRETVERLKHTPLPDHATQAERDAAYQDWFAGQCATYGCD